MSSKKRYARGGNDESDDELDMTPDPWYDEDVDDNTEHWVASRFGVNTERRSDAVLSCPACFAIVCHDCQRHARYKTQYRAMFVQNCKVLVNEQVQPLNPDNPMEPASATDDSKKAADANGSGDNEVYLAVVCSDCNTHLGVRDSEEVYHFINVVPGESAHSLHDAKVTLDRRKRVKAAKAAWEQANKKALQGSQQATTSSSTSAMATSAVTQAATTPQLASKTTAKTTAD